MLDWSEVDLGLTKHFLIQIDLCTVCFPVSYGVLRSALVLFGRLALPSPRGGSASRVSPQSLSVAWVLVRPVGCDTGMLVKCCSSLQHRQ